MERSNLLFLVLLFDGVLTFEGFTDRDYEIYRRVLEIEPLDDHLYYGNFPDDFTWSTATSAHQIEGAWNADGKGESIWDRHTHENNTENGHTADIACNSYYQYEDDIGLLLNLGVDQYRFSIAWTRIQPTGEETVPNAAGVQYYNNLIDALLAAGITPVVTLHHWDLPQALQDKGGYLDDTLFVNAFANFARICFQQFGDRVKLWITLNEPWVMAHAGHGTGAFPPGINGMGEEIYLSAHNMIKAHAEAYHVYDTEFRPTQNGEIGITLNTGWAEPNNRSLAIDVDAAMRHMEFNFGWFAHAVHVNGDYPDVMKFKVAEKSSLQGFNQSRLPVFTEEEKQRNFGTSDFFGLNFYCATMVYHEDRPLFPPSFDSDKDTVEYLHPDWPISGSSWLRMTPFGMRKILAYINTKYGQPRILITENGISDRNGSITDDHRERFYQEYINNVLQAIDLDGANVIGYTAWSLMDNFEWNTGYNEKFGLYHVDFEDPARPRTVKDSVNLYKQIIDDHGFPPPTP